MKTSSAVCKLKLYTSKTLKNGENPIMISVAWGGSQKYASTGFSCTPKYWDAKNEIVKRGYPNYTAINEAILDKKNKVIVRRIEFEKNNIPYTSSMLLDTKEDFRGNKLIYSDLVEQYIKENSLGFNTAKTYRRNFVLLKKHFNREDFLLTELTNDTVKNIFLVENHHLKPNTIRLELQKMITMFNYAMTKGLVNTMPTEGIATVKKFNKTTEKHQCFLESDINKLFECYNNNKKDLSEVELLSLECWITSFSLFGLAPVDLLMLNTSCMKDIDGVISFSTYRNKTHQHINPQLVKAEHPEVTEILEKYLSTANLRGGYIFPCLNGREKDKTEKIKKTSTFSNRLNRGFDSLQKKLGITRDYSMYSARHSFATMLLRAGQPIDSIATALGRRVDSIGCYLANLTKEQDLQELSKSVSLTNILKRIKTEEESA